MDSIFEKIDAQTWTFKGFSPFAVFQNARTWRRYFLLCAIGAGMCWALLGFDSTWSMLRPYAINIFSLLKGEIALVEVVAQSRAFYGTGNRFSSPVIYAIAFIVLSLNLEKYNITKSLNFFTTTALSFMSIGIFEWVYNILYALYQNQIYAVTFAWKQITNLTFFTLFVIIGVSAWLYLYCEDYRFNKGKRTKILALASIGLWVLWVFYPFPIESISVETTVGVWTNNIRFPQTMYAVDLDPLDSLAIGEPFFVENNLIHAINTLTKIVSTSAILSLCCGRKVEHK